MCAKAGKDVKLCVAIPFITNLKAVLWISFIAKSIAIILFMIYGVTYLGFITNVPLVRPMPQTIHKSMYSDYFPMQTVKKNASIVVIVLSATEKYERRNAIRETWWKDCHRHEQIVCKFMIDTLRHVKDSSRILQEINSTNDIIISPIKKGMLFGHRILFAMEWTLHHYNFEYLIRSDDDVLLCIEHILHRHRFTPRTRFMAGVLHCAEEGVVYLDEGVVTFSQDIVQAFLTQNPQSMYCHTYGDQTYSTWIKDLKLNAEELYFIERQIHHHPPASRVDNFRNRTRICNSYIALHGVYGNDMKKFWNRRGPNVFSNNTGLVRLKGVCPFKPTYNWKQFLGIYRFEPKLCNDPSAWEGVGEVKFSRE